MIEVADIFRQYGPAYRAKYAEQIPAIHLQVMQTIEDCRTPVLGGHVYYCPECDETIYRYHSCRNRHCPKCQGARAYRWLEQQQELLLPVPYCMLTFTLPDEVAQVARSHPSTFYDLLFRCSAEATQQLARDPRFIGGQVGMVGVLHTWGRTLVLHPHVHYLLPNGGLAKDGQSWLAGRTDFFLPVKALSKLFRTKFRDALRKTDYFDLVPPEAWEKDWVVHCKPVGDGSKALKYLAPYIFRVAISNSRIVSLENDQVTFRYRDTKTGKDKYCTQVFEFIRRFLLHVLPDGFVKVRYYGFLAPGCRKKLAALRHSLGPSPSTPTSPEADVADTPGNDAQTDTLTPKPGTYHTDGQPEPDNAKPRCPKCGRPMQRQSTIPPQGRCPP